MARSKSKADTFPHRVAVWKYLCESGWKISRSQFYEHCSDGKLARQEDGSYLRSDADKYAGTHCISLATGQRLGASAMADEKAVVALAREKVRLEREEYDLGVRKGKYIPRDEVELMIIGRAIAMLSHLNAMVQMQAEDWIAMVGGDTTRSRELIDTIQHGIEDHVSVFARDIEFEVLMEKENAN